MAHNCLEIYVYMWLLNFKKNRFYHHMLQRISCCASASFFPHTILQGLPTWQIWPWTSFCSWTSWWHCWHCWHATRSPAGSHGTKTVFQNNSQGKYFWGTKKRMPMTWALASLPPQKTNMEIATRFTRLAEAMMNRYITGVCAICHQVAPHLI